MFEEISVIWDKPRGPYEMTIRVRILPRIGDVLHIDGYPALIVQEVQHRIVNRCTEAITIVVTER